MWLKQIKQYDELGAGLRKSWGDEQLYSQKDVSRQGER
jgi:hypothetical protein